MTHNYLNLSESVLFLQSPMKSRLHEQHRFEILPGRQRLRLEDFYKILHQKRGPGLKPGTQKVLWKEWQNQEEVNVREFQLDERGRSLG